jgi:CheY-like chemotaxis protein
MENLLKNITVLVVEDHADTRELLSAILNENGADVMVADSVHSALAVCRRTPPHLVISDIRLGDSDGFALIKAIREYNREYRGFTPAIALTGFAAPGDQERAMASGFNAYLRKPLEPADLIDTVTSLLRSDFHWAA